MARERLQSPLQNHWLFPKKKLCREMSPAGTFAPWLTYLGVHSAKLVEKDREMRSCLRLKFALQLSAVMNRFFQTPFSREGKSRQEAHTIHKKSAKELNEEEYNREKIDNHVTQRLTKTTHFKTHLRVYRTGIKVWTHTLTINIYL